ncbi:MAG: BspA family leucine-rich repeat surface protein, partial [Clostridiales bacterium]|nr:BspA family leucine-rich repeat surface protein [Clostridiales bacterium]
MEQNQQKEEIDMLEQRIEAEVQRRLAEERERQRQQRKKRTQIIVVVAILLCVPLIAFGINAWYNTDVADADDSAGVAADMDSLEDADAADMDSLEDADAAVTNDTDTVTPSGGVLGNVGSYALAIEEDAEVSLDGVTLKEDITEIYFLDTLADAPSDAADLSRLGDGSVLCWTEGSTQYIAGEGGVIGGSSCSYLFAEYINVTAIHFSGHFDTSDVIEMDYMFSGCSSLTEIDVSGWNTSRVMDMCCMFSFCTSLTELDVSGWDTSNVTDMTAMFEACSALVSLDVSDWDTSNVKYMGTMFSLCSALELLDMSGWDTSNVIDMYMMFGNCSALTSLDVSGRNTSNVTEMSEEFAYCSALASLDVSG